MPIETAEDLAAFFNPDEFGERIAYDGTGGLAALHYGPGDPVPFAEAHANLDTHRFLVTVASLPAPAAGRTIVREASGATLRITSEPYRTRDGALWILSAA